MTYPPAASGAASPNPPPPTSRLLQRVPTGVPGLDTVLHGGFLRSGLYLLAGSPGTGKTILSNQIAIQQVQAGGRVVFVSLLTETSTRLFAHLSTFSFFSETITAQFVGDALFYISGYSELQSDGLPGLRALLQGAIRDRQATMLILDGILTAESFASTDRAFREFLRGLQQFAEVSGCTVLLLASRGDLQAGHEQVAVETTVDGVIYLRYRRVGMRAVRELEVTKLRGTAFLPGGHTFDIADQGIVVYPRIEALRSATDAAQQTGTASRERLSFGIAGLDDMLQGGVFRGSTTVLLGPPGSGKTLVGLHFLAAGTRQDERGLYFGFNEPPAVLRDMGNEIGLDYTRLIDEGQVDISWHLASEAYPDVLAHRLLEQVRARQIKRVFIDGLDAFEDLNLEAERLGPFFTALINELRALGVTTLTTVELATLFGPSVEIPISGVSALVENIIFLRYVELRSQLYRLISVLKTRRSGHDPALREFKVDAQGITIASTFTSAEAILTGLARPLPGTTEPASALDHSTLPTTER